MLERDSIVIQVVFATEENVFHENVVLESNLISNSFFHVLLVSEYFSIA